MKRKLIRQGAGGLTVCLPKEWTSRNNLKPGKEVNLEEEDNKLVIASSPNQPTKQKTLDIGEFGLLQIRSIIASAYKAGYSQITLKSVPPSNKIDEIVNTFTGLEIISQSKDQVIIKSFLVVEPKEIENLIIKMLQGVKSLGETIFEDWGKIDKKYLESVHTNFKKSRDHCLRSINITKFGGDKTYDYYDFVTALEKLMAEYCLAAEYIIEYTPPKSHHLKKAFNFFNMLHISYLKNNFKETEKVWVLHNERKKETLKLTELKKSKDELFVFYYGIMQKLQHISSRILSLSS